ncbi:hypothetical protein GGR50DRAFT_637569 [Xylaria sp. CBS 124048]|nr:hypothetical protein GGR50DRAFT_637569 [Xylaria sp. CBS 124048]
MNSLASFHLSLPVILSSCHLVVLSSCRLVIENIRIIRIIRNTTNEVDNHHISQPKHEKRGKEKRRERSTTHTYTQTQP